MNTSNLLLFTTVVALGCVLGVQSLSCYSCNNVSACKNPQKVVCNQALANSTRSYLSLNYKGVNVNQTGTSYNCISDQLTSSMAQNQFKGCLYTTIQGCGLTPNDAHTNAKQTCYQCNRDYCNPAARAYLNSWNLLSTIAVLITAKFVLL